MISDEKWEKYVNEFNAALKMKRDLLTKDEHCLVQERLWGFKKPLNASVNCEVASWLSV